MDLSRRTSLRRVEIEQQFAGLLTAGQRHVWDLALMTYAAIRPAKILLVLIKYGRIPSKMRYPSRRASARRSQVRLT